MFKTSANSPASGTHPEIELVLCCARTHIDSTNAEQIRSLLQKDIDWTYLIQTALRHGVMPLLYWNLNTTCPEAVPKFILNQLKDHFHASARRNLFMTGELLKLLNLFEVHGLIAIPFKGPVLAASVYGNLAFRTFGDLDILVHKWDVLKAKDLLIPQGYRPWIKLTRTEETDRFRFNNVFVLVHDDKQVNVELHWGITKREFSFPLNLERLWECLEPVPLAGTKVLSFAPEDLLLILCEHGAKHLWVRLNWICDVAELIYVHQVLDWERVMKQSSMLGSQRRLFLGLCLANDLLGATLPQEVLQRIQQDSMVTSLATQVYEQLFRKAYDPLEVFEKRIFHLKMMERLQDRVRYIWYLPHRVMTPNPIDQALLPLPVSFSFLYYLLRPIRLVVEYILIPLKNLVLRGSKNNSK